MEFHQVSRIRVLVDPLADLAVAGKGLERGVRVETTLVIDLDRAKARWDSGPPSSSVRPSLGQIGTRSRTRFAGIVRAATLARYPGKTPHHKEFLLDCGVPITAFSLGLARWESVKSGGWLRGVGLLLANFDVVGYELQEPIEVRIEGIRRARVLGLRGQWLVLTIALSARR